MRTGTLPLPPLKSARLLDQLRERLRYLHYSLRTEQAYVYWARVFICFDTGLNPAKIGGPEVELPFVKTLAAVLRGQYWKRSRG